MERRETFEMYIGKLVRKHRLRTVRFNLKHGQWGNLKPMMTRIELEMFEAAPGFPESYEQKMS